MQKVKWGYVIVAVFVLATIAYLLFQPARTFELPKDIAGLQQVQIVDGDRANDILNRMHDKEVTPDINKIGMYSGSTGSAVVYLSVYSSHEKANEAYVKMARSIKNGNMLFTDYREVRIQDVAASFCTGQGQSHYFFVDDDQLYWLTADPDIAQSVASDLVKAL